MSFPVDPNALGGLMSGFQQQMEAMKAEAAATEVTGQAGGGLVKVVANGGMEVVRVSVSDDVMDDREMLEDLITAATNDALREARGILNGKMQQMMGGLPIPPGLMNF